MATVGSTSVGTSAVQVIATSVPLTYGIWIKAGGANTQKVHVGFANTVTVAAAAATDGYELNAGQEIWIPKYVADDASEIYIIAGGASQKVTWLAY